MMIHKYERTPKPSEALNEDGQEFWSLYCRYYLDRNYLTDDLLPDIETLCFLQQQRVEMQNEIKNKGRNEDRLKELKDLVTQIRLLKDAMKIVVRANEFHNPNVTERKEQESKEEDKKDGNMKLLNAKNW